MVGIAAVKTVCRYNPHLSLRRRLSKLFKVMARTCSETWDFIIFLEDNNTTTDST